MRVEIVPISFRRLRQSSVGSYKDYLDELIGMKLRDLDRVKDTMSPRRTLRRAIT